MFGNFFNFQSKNKDGKATKDESSKKSKSKKGKDKKESTAEENVVKITPPDVIKNDDDEQFEDVQTTTNVDNDIDHDVSQASIPSAVPELRSDVPSVPELLLQLEQVENEARRLADGLEQVSGMVIDTRCLNRAITAIN